MTNKLGSANPNRIPKPKMDRDREYLRLMRKLQKAERRLHDIIPMGLNDIKWGELGTAKSDNLYKKGFEALLPTEVQRIEYRRLRQQRQDVYFEVFDFYNNDEKEINRWFQEYHDLDVNDGSYISEDGSVPFLKPKNDIGIMVAGGEGTLLIPKDKLPVTYQVMVIIIPFILNP